jgi:hypothetical protein
MTAVTDEEVIYVPHPDDMDRETFIKHVTARHADSMPDGFDLSADRMTDYVEDCWRRFHERLHRLRTPTHDRYEHDHRLPL